MSVPKCFRLSTVLVILVFCFNSIKGTQNCSEKFPNTPGLHCSDRKEDRVSIKLGYLTSYKRLYPRPKVVGYAHQISGALSYAIDEVNQCACKFKLAFNKSEDLKDTERDESIATNSTIDLLNSNKVAAFIGPEGHICHTSALIATVKNKAMISYGYVFVLFIGRTSCLIILLLLSCHLLYCCH